MKYHFSPRNYSYDGTLDDHQDDDVVGHRRPHCLVTWWENLQLNTDIELLPRELTNWKETPKHGLRSSVVFHGLCFPLLSSFKEESGKTILLTPLWRRVRNVEIQTTQIFNTKDLSFIKRVPSISWGDLYFDVDVGRVNTSSITLWSFVYFPRRMNFPIT